MRETRIIMGMPVTVEISDRAADPKDIDAVFDYFVYVDEKFSTYKDASEISRINRGELTFEDASADMKEIFSLAEQTKKETGGYFDIYRADGKIDPSGIVKGWAIEKAAELIRMRGFRNFYLDVGGDIQVSGKNSHGKPWKIGIRHPFRMDEIVKVVQIENLGVATSGTYIRGQHIYNPHKSGPITDIVSLTVVGPNIFEADRFATAAFAMGKTGIEFIEKLSGFEGYQIDAAGIATKTSGFDKLARSS